MKSISFLYLEETSYQDALQLQELLFQDNINKKLNGRESNNVLIFLQHSPVYTLGKSGKEENLKIPIEESGAEFFRTNRGGDITFHGPGQLVGYPIFDLDQMGIGVREYVFLIEECIIALCKKFNLPTGRIKSASGVWVDFDKGFPRKICALGIKISRGISMHGFAFNINTDLSYFDNIVPCGIQDKGVSSLSRELGKEITVDEIYPQLLEIFQEKFKLPKN